MAAVSALPAGLSQRSALLSRPARAQTVEVAARVTAGKAKTSVKQSTKGGAYVCLDCGYLYTGSEPFDSLSKYNCPVCGAPKRRFKPLQGASKGNDLKSMQANREKLRNQVAAAGGDPDEGGNELLAVTGASALVFLGACYYFFTQQ